MKKDLVNVKNISVGDTILLNYLKHLTNIRMKEAVRLSVETRRPMKEIAERCGYYNVTYFCKVFKKQTGKTISEYRRNL